MSIETDKSKNGALGAESVAAITTGDGQPKEGLSLVNNQDLNNQAAAAAAPSSQTTKEKTGQPANKKKAKDGEAVETSVAPSRYLAADPVTGALMILTPIPVSEHAAALQASNLGKAVIVS